MSADPATHVRPSSPRSSSTRWHVSTEGPRLRRSPRCRATSGRSCTTWSRSGASRPSPRAKAATATPSSPAPDRADVSRETSPPRPSARVALMTMETEPAAAAELFGERIHLARSFAAELGARGEELGLIGPLEPARLWSRHILNCALLAPLLRPGLVGDVGSGAGLPGLVLAIARPDAHLVLIEPMERRTAWLTA